MDIYVDRGAASRAAKVCARVAPKRHAVPVLECVLLEVRGGTLRMSATDTEVAVSLPVAGQMEAAGDVAVPAARLAEVLSMSPEPTVRIRRVGRRVEVSSGRAKTKIPFLAPEDMPPPASNVDATLTARAEAAELAAFLEAASAMPVGVPERAEISGVRIFAEGDALCAVSADAYRVHHLGAPIQTAGRAPRRSLATLEGLSALARALSGAEGEAVLQVGEGAMRVECGGASAWARTIEAEFPDIAEMLPASHRVRLLLPTDALSDAVARTMRVGGGAHNPVGFDVEGEAVTLSAKTHEGEHGEEVPAEVHGTIGPFALNAPLLRDSIRFVAGERVEIRGTQPLNVFTLTDGSEPSLSGLGRTALLMPFRRDA